MLSVSCECSQHPCCPEDDSKITWTHCHIVYLIVSYDTMSGHHAISYHNMYRMITYHIISYRIVSYRIVSYRIISCRLDCYVHCVTYQLPLVPATSLTTKWPIGLHRCRSLRGLRLPKLLFNQLQHELAGELMAVDQRSPLCELEYSIPPKSHVETLDSWNLHKKIHVLDILVTGGMVTCMLVDHDLLVL